MSDWQPIETAPLKQRIILWCSDAEDHIRFGNVSEYSGHRQVQADGLFGDWTFTAWQPLPVPPVDGLPRKVRLELPNSITHITFYTPGAGGSGGVDGTPDGKSGQ